MNDITTFAAANLTYSNNGGTTYAYTPAAGYDTDQVRGNDTAYNNLHACCQYERKQ